MTRDSHSPINVVWLKRDLRLRDHPPLAHCAAQAASTLLLYVYEPSLIADPHYDERHWRFVWQSIQQLNQQLAPYDTQVCVMCCEVKDAFTHIMTHYHVNAVYSHEEVGLDVTFQRDKRLRPFFEQRQVTWQEWPYSVVRRGLRHRSGWQAHWHNIIDSPCIDPALDAIRFVSSQKIEHIVNTASELCTPIPEAWQSAHALMQKGGELWAWHTYKDFFKGRGKHYQRDISKPLASRKSCSRLSPYIAWGNVSIRQVVQSLLETKNTLPKAWNRPLTAYASRLHWHCHFIQKFESESRMQFESINRAYEHYPYETDSDVIEQRLHAWQTGTTGIPIVDANMRAVVATGYINFRMRAMLVSMLTLHFNLDWRLGVTHLAKQFLDFEPGIHYPQFQMQAGVVGTHTIRLYNPIKQSQEKDADGLFIKKWCPELADCPVEAIHTPWQVSPMERLLFDTQKIDSYPAPIVDLEETGRAARDRAWQYKERDDVKAEARRILRRHVV